MSVELVIVIRFVRLMDFVRRQNGEHRTLSLFDIWKEAEAQGSQLPAQLYFASLWLAKFATDYTVHSMTMMKDLPAQVGNSASNGPCQAITASDRAAGDRE